MATIKGIISFPTLFTPKIPKGSTEAKYSAVLLFPPGDPEIAKVKAEFDAALLASYPSGLPPKADKCFGTYDEKFQGKEYYDPKLSGWMVLTCTAKAEDKPVVVDMNHQPIIDPSEICSGMVVYLNVGMSGYVKGTGGIGGWLNGVMSTGQLGILGRLDNRPSAEQMFAGVGAAAPAAPAAGGKTMTAKAGGATYEQLLSAGWSDELLVQHGMMIAAPAVVAPPAPVAAAPIPPAPNAAPPVPTAPVRVMTAAAQGATYEQLITAGWTDALLVQHGMMLPSFQ